MINLLVNNVKIDNTLIIVISIIILVVIIGAIAFIIYKDKKSELKEIDDLIDDMNKSRKEELEEKLEDKPVVSENTIKIEGILDQMQKDLEATPASVVDSFEKEQEEKAIISYQELVKHLKKGNVEENVIKVDEDTLTGDKSLNALVDEIKNPTREIKELEVVKEESLSDTKKFRNTDFISPVYGKMEDKLEYPKVKSFARNEIIDELNEFDEKYGEYNIESYLHEFRSDRNLNTLEQTLDMEPISNEVKQNEDFLQALKEFRENL